MKQVLNSKIIFLLITVAGAIILGWPHLNFLETLSQGDHGRDLYAASAVVRGEVPYKDFWWVYGPLMPYYYGFFDAVFGVQISSVLLGKMFLEIALGAFFFLTAATMMPASWACIGALWFMEARQEFFFTFNHLGGLVCVLAAAYCLFAYIRRQEPRYLQMAGFISFIFMLIKVNFGLACLLGTAVSILLINPKVKKSSLLWLLIAPLAAGLIYGLMMNDLPLAYIRQCQPYFGDDQPHHVSPLTATIYYLQQHWLTLTHNGMNVSRAASQALTAPFGMLIFTVSLLYTLQTVFMHASTVAVIILWARGKIDAQERKPLALALALMGLFFVLYFHEFLVSGVWYRSYWSVPFLTLFHFLMMAIALRHAPKPLRIVVIGLFVVLLGFGAFTHAQSINSQKQPGQYLSMPAGGIYVGNEPAWVDTVNRTTDFLNNTLKKDELFFALPYDCLYYYLTGKPTPTPLLIFFAHIHLQTAQELDVIRDLESKRVNYVLMSNRVASSEIGMGIFGQTHCPLLAQYIRDKFTPVFKQGGDWQAEPGWAHNHGVIVFKRK